MKSNSHKMESPYGKLDDAFPEAKGKLVYIWEDEAEDDNFKPPCMYYVLDSSGGRMYFKTIKRGTAQTIADKVYGVGKYTVRAEMKANIR